MSSPSEEVISVAAVASSFLDVLDDSNEFTPESEELRTRKEKIASELNLYFQAPTIPRDASPAAYWKLHETIFPHLTALFKKYGTAPATNAEVERLFSLAGNIVTDLRKRLGVERLEKLLFLNANLPLLKI
uniref:HAT C-terminal dimerisation domain-containing protein n=1 Tax=Panagrolaimus davidi TaxID=227884 RepID=A0A914QZR9_9BILA